MSQNPQKSQNIRVVLWYFVVFLRAAYPRSKIIISKNKNSVWKFQKISLWIRASARIRHIEQYAWIIAARCRLYTLFPATTVKSTQKWEKCDPKSRSSWSWSERSRKRQLRSRKQQRNWTATGDTTSRSQCAHLVAPPCSTTKTTFIFNRQCWAALRALCLGTDFNDQNATVFDRYSQLCKF